MTHECATSCATCKASAALDERLDAATSNVIRVFDRLEYSMAKGISEDAQKVAARTVAMDMALDLVRDATGRY